MKDPHDNPMYKEPSVDGEMPNQASGISPPPKDPPIPPPPPPEEPHPEMPAPEPAEQ